MKRLAQYFTVILILVASDAVAQYGYGSPYGRNNRFGRQRSAIPQTPTPEKEPEKLTAEQMVDLQMPKIIETIDLDPFEQAIVRTIFTNSVQKRMELQILQLEPQKMKEEYEKIRKKQDEELKAALPEDKYLAFQKMFENPNKSNREAKKKKKKKKKKDTSN